MLEDTQGRLSIRIEAIDSSGTADWQLEAVAGHVNILNLALLRAMDINEIFYVSRSRRWVIWMGVIEYVDAGCSFGIVLKGDRPSVRINLPASRFEGMNSGSQLLMLAQIVPNPEG